MLRQIKTLEVSPQTQTYNTCTYRSAEGRRQSLVLFVRAGAILILIAIIAWMKLVSFHHACADLRVARRAGEVRPGAARVKRWPVLRKVHAGPENSLRKPMEGLCLQFLAVTAGARERTYWL